MLRNRAELPLVTHSGHLALTAIENTSAIKEKRTSSVTQPIPVPTQIHNYEKMQESRDRAKSMGDTLTDSPTASLSNGMR